jgi:hypothetical protein
VQAGVPSYFLLAVVELLHRLADLSIPLRLFSSWLMGSSYSRLVNEASLLIAPRGDVVNRAFVFDWRGLTTNAWNTTKSEKMLKVKT